MTIKDVIGYAYVAGCMGAVLMTIFRVGEAVGKEWRPGYQSQMPKDRKRFWPAYRWFAFLVVWGLTGAILDALFGLLHR